MAEALRDVQKASGINFGAQPLNSLGEGATSVGYAACWERRSSDRHAPRDSAAHGTTRAGAVALCSRFITADSDTTSAGLRPAVLL